MRCKLNSSNPVHPVTLLQALRTNFPPFFFPLSRTRHAAKKKPVALHFTSGFVCEETFQHRTSVHFRTSHGILRLSPALDDNDLKEDICDRSSNRIDNTTFLRRTKIVLCCDSFFSSFSKMSKGGDEEKHEPKENDKCMEKNDRDKATDVDGTKAQSSRLDQWRGRAKQFASNRVYVIVSLLCVVLFILFLIVIILSVRLGTFNCNSDSQCRTSDCLITAAAVVKRSELTVDPCDDFFSYSCKGWVETTPLPKNKGSFSVSDQLKKTIYARIRHLIDLVPHDVDSAAPERKVKSFYSSCRDLKEIEHWVPTKIRQAIHEIGGWAIIGDTPSHEWKRNDVLKMLQVTYGVEPFFKVLVEPDDTSPMRNIIKVS